MSSLPAVPEGMLAGIRGFWYPILPAADLATETSLAIRRLGEDLVVWRSAAGQVMCFEDRCPHRSAPLSLGHVVNDRIECRYHGLQFDQEGACRSVPIDRVDDGPSCRGFQARTYPTTDRAGYIWSFLADEDVPVPPLELEPEIENPDYDWHLAWATFEANWLTVLENALDPAHVPFLHYDAPFVTNARDAAMEWFLPSKVTSRTETVATPSGAGLRTAVLQIATRPEGGDEVEHFYAPNLNRIPVPIPGPEPMHSVHYHTPIDEHRTLGYWYLVRKVADDADRASWREQWDKFLSAATNAVYMQDVEICEAQTRGRRKGGAERLLPQDGGFLRARRVLIDLYERQQRA